MVESSLIAELAKRSLLVRLIFMKCGDIRLHGWSGSTRRNTRSSGRAGFEAEALGLGVCVGTLAGSGVATTGCTGFGFFLTTWVQDLSVVLELCGPSPSIGLVGIVEAGSLPFIWLPLCLARICTGREMLAVFLTPGPEAGTAGCVVLLPMAAFSGPLDRGWSFPRRMSAIMACRASPFFSTARRS